MSKFKGPRNSNIANCCNLGQRTNPFVVTRKRLQSAKTTLALQPVIGAKPSKPDISDERFVSMTGTAHQLRDGLRGHGAQKSTHSSGSPLQTINPPQF